VFENYPAIFEWLGLLDVNTVVMLVLMTVVAVINMISALLIMILERTAMIGMLKAMGARNWVIQKVFLYNAAYLIGVGCFWAIYWAWAWATFSCTPTFLNSTRGVIT
jgi:lipoprotein-releasing system permease protein